MKLQLKHLSPYLPHGLETKCEGKVKIMVADSPLERSYEIGIGVFLARTLTSGQFKPFLRPLSDLTKQIEYCGKKFVPYKKFGIDDTFGKFDDFLEVDIFDVLNYGTIEQLLEWHFDVFGLLGAGLAIKINKLSTEKAMEHYYGIKDRLLIYANKQIKINPGARTLRQIGSMTSVDTEEVVDELLFAMLKSKVIKKGGFNSKSHLTQYLFKSVYMQIRQKMAIKFIEAIPQITKEEMKKQRKLAVHILDGNRLMLKKRFGS